MNRHGIFAACAVASIATVAAAQDLPRAEDVARERAAVPVQRADAHCRLRISVDERAVVRLHGAQIAVDTRAGRRSYDAGSFCSEPLPAHPVRDFRVTAVQGRGHILDVHPPRPGNGFTSSIELEDPAPAAGLYEIEVAWNDPGLG